jgi:PIN domain/Plasmid pRiA4b ORF-3-like protein
VLRPGGLRCPHRPAATPATDTCTFRVRILGGFYAPSDSRGIWREIELRADQTLADLGGRIPPAFGFDDDHLWSFFLSGKPWDSASEFALTPSQALDLVGSWLAQPCATVVHPTSRHAPVLRQLLEPLGTAGNLTTDAHLAALAIEHGAELCSTDTDFSRFAGLNWINPLEP